MFETEEAKQFFAAWQALRSGKDLPHFRAVFQHLPTDMLPQAMIFERVSGRDNVDQYVVRFMGTRAAEYWSRDITGHDILSLMSPKTASAGRRNMATVLAHPCGLISMGAFSIVSRDELAVESVIVPASNDPGRPARILGFLQDLRPPLPLDDDRLDMARRRWIDIGFGVPPAKPAS
ncbi:MAG: PAS domain-containing protein [Rhodospirillaceae bacterium]